MAKNKLLFSALQAGRVFVIVHFREAFFCVFFFSFFRAYITITWNTNGHQHKHHLQGCSMKLRQIVLKLA